MFIAIRVNLTMNIGFMTLTHLMLMTVEITMDDNEKAMEMARKLIVEMMCSVEFGGNVQMIDNTIEGINKGNEYLTKLFASTLQPLLERIEELEKIATDRQETINSYASEQLDLKLEVSEQRKQIEKYWKIIEVYEKALKSFDQPLFGPVATKALQQAERIRSHHA